MRKMKKLEFQIDDISFLDGEQQYRIPSLKFAQAKFDDWYRENIEIAPLVYNYNEGLRSWWNPKEMPTTAVNPTRQARLILIQEIKKECVKHEPMSFEAYTIDGKYICRHCSVELILEWRAKP